MTHSSHTAAWPQTTQGTGEAAGTDERQPSRDHHQDDHYGQKPQGSIVLTCGDAGTRSISSEIAGVSHLTADFAPEAVAAAVAAYNALVPAGITARGHAEVTALFGGLRLVPPGVVPVSEWRPDHAVHGVSTDVYAGLATVTGRSR